MLEVRGLKKHFKTGGGLLGVGEDLVRAVDGVSFSIAKGETFGLVGESGCGKTTVGRCVLRLVEPTEGEVVFEGQNLLELGRGDMRRRRRDMQIIFQDPFASLNPRMRVGDIVEEPLAIHGVGARAERRRRAAELLDEVGLDADAVMREVEDGWPHEQYRKEHMAAEEQHKVWGVPTFIAEDHAVFVRLMSRPEGDGELARTTIERTLDILVGFDDLNEFKHTSIPR